MFTIIYISVQKNLLQKPIKTKKIHNFNNESNNQIKANNLAILINPQKDNPDLKFENNSITKDESATEFLQKQSPTKEPLIPQLLKKDIEQTKSFSNIITGFGAFELLKNLDSKDLNNFIKINKKAYQISKKEVEEQKKAIKN